MLLTSNLDTKAYIPNNKRCFTRAYKKDNLFLFTNLVVSTHYQKLASL